MADTEKVQVKLEDGDPQSVQDLTGFVPFHVQHVVKSLKSILADICCCVSPSDTELRLFWFQLFRKNWYLHEGLTENLFLVWWIFFEILNDSGFAVLLRFSFFSTGANATAANGKRETSVYIFKLYLVPVNSTSFNFFFVSRLQQDKFQQMSDQIITRNILYII